MKKTAVEPVLIGKFSFKDAEDFKDYANDKMQDFLSNIEKYGVYTYPSDNDSIFEKEEGISFYYTDIGLRLVDRWIEKMKKIFEKYFPEDYGFEPRCCYYRDL